MLTFFKKLGPPRFRRWLLDMVPIEQVQHVKELVDIIDQNTREIFFGKRAALEAGDAAVKEQVANGNDIMSILRKWAHMYTGEYHTKVKNPDSAGKYERLR